MFTPRQIHFVCSLLFLLTFSASVKAQKPIYLLSSGKKSFSDDNAIFKYEVRSFNRDTFEIFSWEKRNNKWKNPELEFKVLKQSENVFHIYKNENLTGNYQIREITDTAELGFKITQTDQFRQPVFSGDALQVFPLLLHGKSTVFDKEGMPMTNIFYLMGKKINEEIIFTPFTDSIKITRLPEFPGGLKEFQKQIAKKISFPARAQRNKISGAVYVKFLIDKDGKIKQISPALNTPETVNFEAVKVIKSINKKWKPAEHDGITIPVWYYAKVSFLPF